MSLFHDQYEFLQAGDVDVGSRAAEDLASDLVYEEFHEFGAEAHCYNTSTSPQVNVIKEALDLMYVTAQYLNVTIGPDKAKECWDALHQNNMSKCIDGKLVKREDGKVLKGPNYKPLDLSKVLRDTG